MGEWKETTLNDVCKNVVTGGTPLSSVKEYFENGDIPWLKTKEVNFNRITVTENYISSKGLANSSARLIPANSVIIAMYGQGDTAGRVAINKIPLSTNQACCNLLIDEKKANYNFIYYFLSNSYEELVLRKTGSAQPNLNTKLIKDFPISLPPLPEQTAIASVLSSLDDKIDLLHRQNATLEKMAETLFRQWFVEEAKEEWKYQLTLGDLTESVSITHKFPNPSVVFLNTSDIYLGNVIEHNPTSVKGLPGQAKKTIRKNDILFSEIRPANGRWAYIDFEAENYVVSTKLMVLRSKNVLSQAFIYFYLTNPATVEWLQMIAESRSGTFPQITFDQIKDLKINVPADKILEDSITWCESTLKKLKSNQTQIRTLTALRDTLLPKLMSGEVSVIP